MEERDSFDIKERPSLEETTSLTSVHNYKCVEVTDIIDNPCIELETVNPRDSSFKTVVIQNFRYDV